MVVFPSFEKEKNCLVVDFPPQIGFRTRNQEYDFYLPDEIPSKDQMLNLNYKLKEKDGIISVGINLEELEKILNKLEIKDKFEKRNDIELSESVITNLEGEISNTIIRALAKIAFNYLIYKNRDKIDIFYRSEFDSIRNFVLKGDAPKYNFYQIDTEKILADEKNSAYHLEGHLIVLKLAEDRTSILSEISLFNQFRYTIWLTKDYHADLKLDGDFFDFNNKKIIKLTKQGLVIIPFKKIILP